MTNITAIILVTVATNWTEIGTLHKLDGKQEKVEQSNLQTNTYAIMEYQQVKKEFLLDSKAGPVIGERRTPFLNPWIVYQQWPTNIMLTNLDIRIHTNKWKWGVENS